MSVDYLEKYNFEAEWYDKVACILRKFYLHYYPSDNTIELFDLKTKKTFLKRTKCEGIQAKDFFVGAMVTIYSRCMKITDYADGTTKMKLQTKMQKTCALLKPDIVDKMGEILHIIISHNFQITNIKMVQLTLSEASTFYEAKDDPDITYILEYFCSGPLVAIELMGDNGIAQWSELLGPTDPNEARKTHPTSLRALFGNNKIRNGLHGSENEVAAVREASFFFPLSKTKTTGSKSTATFKNCTCCIIKPHAVQAKLTGDIINDIQKAGYDITAIQQFCVHPVNAEEFLEIYKGVLPDYGAMIAELQSGPCIAMELKHKDEKFDVHGEFRKLCGPMDPEMARQVRPNTLRARYGKSRVQNAVHCSDLAVDGPLEVEYFFKILQ